MEQKEMINKVRTGELSPLEFLKASDEFKAYKDWCDSHCEEINADTAELYFNQEFSSDYDESEILMEM